MILLTLRRRLIGNQKGQALVELALVVPILLILVLGIVEFGRVFSAYMTIQHAAREGVRLGILGATDGEIISRVQSNSTSLDPTKLAVTVTPQSSLRTPGTVMTVSVAYDFVVAVPMLDSLLGSSIPVSAVVAMRVE